MVIGSVECRRVENVDVEKYSSEGVRTGDVGTEEGVEGESVWLSEAREEEARVCEGSIGGEGGEGEDTRGDEVIEDGAGGDGVGVHLVELLHGGTRVEMSEHGILGDEQWCWEPWRAWLRRRCDGDERRSGSHGRRNQMKPMVVL